MATENTEYRWWRMPIWWLVWGGPLVVVVASFVTLYIAVDGADQVLPRAPGDGERSTLPAREGRNLAATPAPAASAAPAAR